MHPSTPSICTHFGINTPNTFGMLRLLSVVFDLCS